jgi:hypothetical protein
MPFLCKGVWALIVGAIISALLVGGFAVSHVLGFGQAMCVLAVIQCGADGSGVCDGGVRLTLGNRIPAWRWDVPIAGSVSFAVRQLHLG